VLQSDRRQTDKPVRLRRANLGELLVLQFDDLTGEFGLGLVPKDRVDAERFDVDALFVHRLDAFRRDGERLQLYLQSHKRIRLGHMAMSVHVDGPDALSIDDDLAPPLRRLRRRGVRQTASAKREARQRASTMAEHFSSVCHHLRSPKKTASDPKSYSTGTKIECRIFPSTCCDKLPLPAVSSTRITSPTLITRLSPSLAVIFTPARD